MTTPSRAPQVSVILPTFNRAALLARSAGSVLRQTFTDLELLIVDDGSTEDVRAAAAALGDPRVRYLRREHRGGVAAARNTGLAAARGEWVAFQDSDDEWLLDKLRLQRAAAAAAPAPDAVLCRVLRIRGRGVSRYPARLPPDGRLAERDVLSNPFAYCQSWLVRRAALAAEGGFDESMRNWSDWEMLIRLVRRARLHCLADALVVSPQVADSLTMVRPAWAEALGHILDKHAAPLARQPAERALLRYVHARLLIASGRLGAARRELARNVAAVPPHWKSAALLVLTLAGPRFAARLVEA